MGSIRKFRGLQVLQALVLVGLTLSLLATPSVRAGLSATSPAQDEQVADPGTVDGVAIRGTTARSSKGPNDVPIGVVGLATGSASGTDGQVAAVGAASAGSALGVNSEVDGVLVRATGDATGAGSSVVGIRAVVTGSPTGQDSDVTGIVGVARTTSVGPNPATGVRGRSDSPFGIGVAGVARATSGFAVGVAGRTSSPNGLGVFGSNLATSVPPGSQAVGILGEAFSTSDGVGVQGQSPSRGVVGLAQATSGFNFGVAGRTLSPDGIGVYGINPGGVAGRFDGRVQINCPTFPCVTVNGLGVLDIAENLPVSARVAPGEVVVVTEGKGGYGIAPASLPYDTRVAGVVSTNPPVLLQSRQREQAAPVAMVGVVKAKATVANGPIRVGDLLTTSGIPGHLMRCPTALRCVGAVVGKALEPLAKGEKEILVMLWRQ